MKRPRAALLAPLFLFTASCIILPLPRVKPQAGPKKIARIEVGTSSKDEVRSLLREPFVEVTEDIWVYTWFTRKLNLFVVVAGGAGGVGPVGVQDYRALVVFGPDGRVVEFELQARPKGPRAQEDLVAPTRSAKLPIKGFLRFHVEADSDSPRVLAGCGYHGLCSWRLDAPQDLDRRELPPLAGSRLIAFSAAGEIAAAGRSGTVLVAPDGQDWRTLRPAGRGRVEALAWSNDGTTLAIARRRTLAVFDVALLREIDVFESPSRVSDLQFSPEGSLLAASGVGGVHVFRADTGALLTSIPTACIASGIAFSPDGARLAVNGGSYVATYAVADLVGGEATPPPRQVLLLPFGTGETLGPSSIYRSQIAYSRSSRYLAAVTGDSLAVLDLSGGVVLEMLPHPEPFVSGLAFLRDDRIVTFSPFRVYEWTVARGNDPSREP